MDEKEVISTIVAGVGLLLLAVVLGFILAVPTAWLLMVFLGNLGINLSFWGAFPGALLISVLATKASKKS